MSPDRLIDLVIALRERAVKYYSAPNLDDQLLLALTKAGLNREDLRLLKRKDDADSPHFRMDLWDGRRESVRTEPPSSEVAAEPHVCAHSLALQRCSTLLVNGGFSVGGPLEHSGEALTSDERMQLLRRADAYMRVIAGIVADALRPPSDCMPVPRAVSKKTKCDAAKSSSSKPCSEPPTKRHGRLPPGPDAVAADAGAAHKKVAAARNKVARNELNPVAGSSFRPKAAARILGVSVATLYRWIAERADFPRPRRLSSRCTVFDGAELLAWRDAQLAREMGK